MYLINETNFRGKSPFNSFRNNKGNELVLHHEMHLQDATQANAKNYLDLRG